MRGIEGCVGVLAAERMPKNAAAPALFLDPESWRWAAGISASDTEDLLEVCETNAAKVRPRAAHGPGAGASNVDPGATLAVMAG